MPIILIKVPSGRIKGVFHRNVKSRPNLIDMFDLYPNNNAFNYIVYR